jgi:hypothetical protein
MHGGRTSHVYYVFCDSGEVFPYRYGLNLIFTGIEMKSCFNFSDVYTEEDI